MSRGGKRSGGIKPGEVRNPRGRNQYSDAPPGEAKKIIADVKAAAQEWS